MPARASGFDRRERVADLCVWVFDRGLAGDHLDSEPQQRDHDQHGIGIRTAGIGPHSTISSSTTSVMP